MNVAPLRRAVCALTLLIAAAALAAATLDMPTRDACIQEDSYETSAIVVLVDRTTVLDQAAQERWATGVATIFSSHEVVGKLGVYEVRESAVGARLLGSGCLSDFRPQSEQGSKVPFLDHPWDWSKEQTRRLWKSASTRKRSSKEENTRIWDERAARTEYAKALQAALAVDRPTGVNTEIAQSLISALHSSCGGREVCRVYMFSDLLDTSAKREARNQDGEQKGAVRASALLQEIRPEIGGTKVIVRVWGFGRDDSQAGRPLDDAVRRFVRAYWRGYFEELKKSAAPGSSFDIADMLRQP